MIGVFVFPTKTKDNDYAYKKDPRKVLEITDEEVVLNARKSLKGLHFWINYTEDYSKLSDEELIKEFNKRNKYETISIASKHSGKGYTTTDKDYLVRIVKNTREWFKNMMGR